SQREQRQLLVIRLPRPFGVVLRAEVHDQQGARGGQRVDHALQKRLAAAINPVQVFEQDNRRLAFAARLGKESQHFEKVPLSCLRVRTWRRPLRIGHTEELEEQRERSLEHLVPRQRAGYFLPGVVVAVQFRETEVITQEL